MAADDRSEDEMWGVAFRLAVSGKYADSAAIEAELRHRGFAHVDNIAKSKFAREQITAMCQKARQVQENERVERKLSQPKGK